MTMLCLCKFDVKQKFTVQLDCEAQILLCVNHSYAYALQYSPQMQLLKAPKYNILFLIPLLLQPSTCIHTALMTMLCLFKFDGSKKSLLFVFLKPKLYCVNHSYALQVSFFSLITSVVVTSSFWLC